jgi:DNA-binding response OmpR family regulator
VAASILLVDDDDELRTSLRRGLALEGYRIRLAADGQEALSQARNEAPDLVVLDLMLPELDGLEVCRRLRAADDDLPIIMLTARDAVADRVAGLENGADDYLVKPFAFEELLARIRVCLRRAETLERTEPRLGEQRFDERRLAELRRADLHFADLRLDTAGREAWRGERRIALTTTEYKLLQLFMRHPRQVLTRDQIYERVWGYDFQGESKVIEVYVRYLREKLETEGEPRLIHTLRGAGYVLRQEP